MAPKIDERRPRVEPGQKVVQTMRDGAYEYVQEYVRCGKNCETCRRGGKNFDPERPGHGPYWYVRITLKNGRIITRYVGKHLRTGGEARKP